MCFVMSIEVYIVYVSSALQAAKTPLVETKGRRKMDVVLIRAR